MEEIFELIQNPTLEFKQNNYAQYQKKIHPEHHAHWSRY
jgi:hypothetical protein